MERGFKTADAILLGDPHLRDSIPSCRDAEFLDEQWECLDAIQELSTKHNGCPVLCAGDLFDHWKPSPYLLAKTLEHLPKNFHTVYGNHDLPQHNLEMRNKCGIYVLEKAGALDVFPNGIHWEQPVDTYQEFLGRKMLVWHYMIIKAKALYPGATDERANSIMKQYPEIELFITGHNHQSFIEKIDGRLLVNAGCMTRQTMTEAKYVPTVYLYYASTNSVVPFILPTKGICTVPDNAEKKKERDDRIEAFISTLKDNWEVTVDFEKNLEAYMENNKTRKDVKAKILEVLNN